MKKVLLIGWGCLMTVWGQAQFHIKVTCNPDHAGKVNATWLNNYIVIYTADEGKHWFPIQDKVTYQGFRDDGTVFHTCAYEIPSFRTQQEAFLYALPLASLEKVGWFEAGGYQAYLDCSASYAAENKRHPIHGKPPKEEPCQEIIIH